MLDRELLETLGLQILVVNHSELLLSLLNLLLLQRFPAESQLCTGPSG